MSISLHCRFKSREVVLLTNPSNWIWSTIYWWLGNIQQQENQNEFNKLHSLALRQQIKTDRAYNIYITQQIYEKKNMAKKQKNYLMRKHKICEQFAQWHSLCASSSRYSNISFFPSQWYTCHHTLETLQQYNF